MKKYQRVSITYASVSRKSQHVLTGKYRVSITIVSSKYRQIDESSILTRHVGENYDEFDSNAQLRGRSTDRTVKPEFKRPRRKSPCVQLGRPRRKTPQIENIRQGYSFARNHSIPEMKAELSLGSPVPSNSSLTGGSNDSIPSLFSSNISSSRDSLDTTSSETSSSGLYILPKKPSRPSSRNTCNDIHSEWTSTTSLDQEMDDTAAPVNTISRLTNSSDKSSSAEVQAGTSFDQELEDSEVNDLKFAALQTQNQTGLKVSLRIIISELKVF